jgi:two-component system, LytTR family, response regulator
MILKHQDYYEFKTINKDSEFIPFSDILYLEGAINYTLIHLKNGSRKVVCRTMAHVHGQLASRAFVRVHRSYCVNTEHLHNTELKYNDPQLELCNGIQLQVSRRRLTQVRKLLLN